MFSKNIKRAIRTLMIQNRNFSTSNSNFKKFKIAILGAGGIGQALALLLKTHPLLYKISLYDIVPSIKGIAMDLSHIATASQVRGYGEDELYDAIECSDIVVITAGMARKPGMTRDDVFDKNAGVVAKMARACATACPEAIVELVTNPVNSMLPIVCDIFQQECVLKPHRIFGISTLDTQRAKVFAGHLMGCDPECVHVPVICGHSNTTILPVFSHCHPALCLPEDRMRTLIDKVRNSGDDVLKAKMGIGTATLSMAFAAYHFTKSILRALNCEPNVCHNAFVMCDCQKTKYFALPFQLNNEGIKKFLDLPKLSKLECELMEEALPDIRKNVKTGEDFAAKLNASIVKNLI